ncbi:MAG: autotransporter-associated beta strand repeat-containing protein [Gemmataceae bacterium]
MANPGSPAVIGFAVQDPLVHAEISGTISGGGSNLIFGKSGTGTLILSGNNTFLVRPTAGSGVNLDQADGIRIDAGILRVAHSNALGGGGYANVNVRGDLGAALEIDGTAGNVDITNRHLILFGPDNGIARGYLNRTSSEAVATGVLRNIAGTNRVTGQIDLRNIGTSTTNAVTIYIGVDAGRLDLNGQIIGTTNVAGTTTVNNRNLYKVGEGTLRYSGGAGNTINGNTVVIAGTLELNKSAGNAIAGPLIIGDNEGAAGSDQVVLLNNNQIADNTTTVTIQSTGSLVLGDFQDAIFGPTGTNTNVLSLVLGDGKSASVSSTNLGALILGRNTTNTSGILVTPRPGVSNVVPATIEGNLQLRTATDSAGRTRQITVDDSPADVELLVTANILNGGVDDTTNGAVNKLGLGRMVLNPDDASTYTGNTTVSAGVLQVQKSEALGLGTTVTVAAGASLELDGDLTINKNLNASGTGLFNGPVSTRRVAPEGTGAVRSISGDSTWTGNVSLNANPTVFRNEAGTSLTLNGAITLGATGNEFVKTGEGTLILAGTTDNIITSVSFVLSGTLVLNKQGTANALRGTLVIGDEFSPATVQYGPDAGTAQMLNTAAILISSTGILDLATNDKTDQFGEIRLTVGATSSSQIHTGSGAAVLTNNTFRVITMPGTTTLSPAALVTGNLHLGPSGTVTRTFTVDASLANDHLIIDGVIANGGATAANVTKTGFGTMVLQGSAPNIYTGTTTVNQGTLALAKDAGVDAVPGNLVIGDNVAYGQTDIVILRNNQQIADTTNVVTVNSSGLLDLNGFNETLIGPVAANSNALTLQINAVYSAVVDTNGGTLTLGGPATNSNVNVVNAGNTTFHSPAAVIRGNINLGDNPRRFDVVNSTVVSDAVNLDMSQAIVSGTGGLTKLGVGTLLLGVNNATGTTNVLDGLVILSGTHAPDLVVGDGIGADNTAQVWMTASDLIANTANVRVNAEGVWLLGMNAVQGISITSTPATFFTLTFDDGVNQFTTRPIATNATAAVVQTALQDLPNINIGDVLVTGGTDVFGIRYFTIQFRNGDPRSSTGLGLQAINPLIISAIPGQPALFPPDMQTDIYAGASQSQTIAELTMERGVVTTPGSADIATGTGTLTMTGDMTLLNRGATINTSPPATITGNLNLAGASRIFSVVDSATAGAATDLLIMATISNGGIIKTNTGTLELGGFQDNTYALATEIQVGAILLAKARVNEIQAITVDPSVTAGQFTISYGGYTTAPLNFNATTAQVQTQLLSLPSIGAGGVAVAGSPGAYEVTFIGNLANANVEEMTVANLSLVGGDVSVFTARDGQSDEIQTISLDGGVTGGTFTINFNGRTTAPIAFNATAAAVQAALQALAPEIGTGNVTVLGGGGANGVYTLIFRNGLGSANVPEVTVDATSLIGGGATVATVSDGFSFNAIPTGTIIIGDGAGTDALNLGASHQIGDLVAVTMLDTTGVPQFNLNGFSEEIGSLASAGTNAVVAMGGNNPTLTTGGNNASTTFNGVISSSVAGMGNLTKVGTGEFTLAGTAANTFTGTTWIREGVLILQKTAGVDALRGPIVVGDGIGGQDADELRLGASNQIQDAATVTITITQSGLFDLNGFIETITGPAAGVVLTLELGPTASARITNSDLGNPSTLTLGGAAGASNVNVVALAGTDDTSPPVLIDGNLSLSLGNQTRTFTVADTETPSTNTDLRVEVPVIQSAATGALIKAGPGTMTLNALNTYTGATTVNDGILGGNGTLTGPLTINSGATLSPGDNGTGIFTVNNNVTFNAGAFYFVEINGPTVGTEYDRLSVNGNVSIDNSATLVGSTVFDIANGVSFIIIEKVSAGLITGAFGNADQLSPPDVVFVGGKSYIYNFDGANYVGGSGRDLELNSVKTTREWDGESLTTNNWTDAVNWVGDVAPFVGDDLLFRNLGLVRPNPFNDFAPDTDFGLITIDATGGSYDLQGNRVRFADATGGILHQSGTHTISLDLLSATNPLTLTSNGTQLNVNGAITLGSGLVLTGTGTNAAINGDIGESGSQTVTKQGAGTWTLAGNNTYTGLTTVSAGTLQVDGGSAILDTNTVNVNVAGATLALLDDETIGTLNGVAGGIVQLNANTLTVGAGSFAGNINGSGGLTKNTAGILTLSGTNSYTGVTNIDAGTLQVMGGSALVDTGTVSVNIAGATFELLNDETIGTLNGVAGGIVQLNANTLTVGAGSFAGAINGSGGLTKNTAGILLLNGTNGYTGTTNIDAGTLRVDGGSALVDTGTVSVNTAGATFELLADETIGTLNGVANSTVQLNANTLTVGAGNFLGVIDGTGGLTKTTVGTLALGGVNTYTGTTNINGGFLLVNGSTAAGSTVEVNNTGTLGGTGTINGPVNVNSGGTINPGPNGAAPANTGILTVNNTVTFNLGSFFHVDINGTTPGTQHDQLTVTGTGAVIINAGATLVGTTDPLIINGLSFVVLNKASTGFISGAFTNANLVSPPATVSVGGKTYTYNFNGTNYVGGSGRDLVLTTTPTIRVWDGIEDGGANSGDNNWTNPLNWVGDAQPFAGDALFFNDVGVVNRNLPFNDFAAGFSFSSITFNTTLGNYTITGNAITMQATLGGGVFHSAGNNVLNIGLNMTASPQTVEATGGTLTIGGAITLGAGANLSVNANPGNVIFNNTIDGDQTLTTSGAGTVRFADTVGATTPLVSLTTSNAGVTEIFTSVVRTNGAQSYNNPVLVDSPTNLLTITTLAGGNVSFASTLRGNTDGEDSITINSSGTTTFGGAVGDSGQRLNNLLVNSTGVIAINGGSVTTLGNQTYNQAVTLGAAGNATTLTGVDVFFASTVRSPVNGQQALTVNASGVTTFAGAVGDNDQRLASLTTNAGGTTRINGGSVTTTGDQTYNDVVTLGADTILTGANITFDDTLDSAGAHRHLTVNGSATTRFNGWVGFTLPLASLTTNAGGTTVIDAGEVHTIGNQTYNDPVILESDTLLNAGGTVHFATTVNSAATEQNDLTITANTLIFGGNVGFGTNGELGDLIVSTATALNLSVSIRAAGDMFFEVQFDTNPNRQITINNNSTIMSLGGDITFEASTGFTLASGSTLSATAGSIFVTANYTLAAADGIAVLLQGIVNATQMTITGGDLADTFTIAPSATTPIDVAGLLPVAPVVVGDALFIIMAGVTNPKLTITAPGDGFWTFGNRQTVTFTSIERFNFTEIRATGTGPGGGPHVKVWDSFTGQLKFSFFAYNGGFTGGVRVAVGDVTGDGIPDIITAPGAGGGPHIRVFDGVTGQVVREFFAYAPSFTGGVFVAVGDVNGDGVADIITAPGAGGGPHVKVFDGVTNAVIGSFFAYAPSFTGGVTVAAGDVTGNGMAEVITGAGAGGGPHVRTFNGMTGAQIAHPLGSFFAYHSSFTGGVFVAAGDINGDGRADIVTGPGAGGGPHVKAFSGANGGILASFMAFEPAGPGPINQVVNDANLTSGVRVAVTNVNGLARFFVSLGANAQPRARVFDAATLALIDDFFAYDPAFLGGVFVGGSNR